jgi:hypothetical protein
MQGWYQVCGKYFANARIVPTNMAQYLQGGMLGIVIANARAIPESWHGDCRGGGWF